ncbi:MAG: phosphate ABC transporter substrate-binding protein, partial [Leptospira sp.]|nr:phosphate ABC transporter substrate-binding protein [Leptospira sp.]
VGCKKKEKLKITGSETMHSMMGIIGTEYMKKSRKISVEVKGGGSAEGIEELVKGETNIAVSSRGLIDKELLDLEKQGKIEQIVIAYDGTAIITHPNNSVQQITLDSASDIFSGKITNWKDLGGDDMPIQVLIRNDKSGTAFYFREHILRKKDLGEEEYRKNRFNEFTKNAKIMQTNEEMGNFISGNKGSVGYMGMGSAEVDAKNKVKPLKYSRTGKEEAVVASIENVYNRKYKLARPLYLIYITNSGNKIDEFVSFVTGEEGQAVIRKSGYLRSALPEVEVKGFPEKK